MKKNIRFIELAAFVILLTTVLAVSMFAASSCAVAEEPGSNFIYTSGGETKYATADQTFTDVISLADPGSEIKLLNDVFVYAPASSIYARIRNGLTIDLCGNTLYFSQSHKNYSFFRIETAEPVTVKNGTVIWNVNEYYTSYCSTSISAAARQHCSYALFSLVTNNATVNFENLKAYGSNILHSYSHTGSTVNITGGEYHISQSSDLLGAGLVDIRANTTLNVSNALIDLTRDPATTLFTLTSYKEKGEKIESKANFNNCDIIASDSTANVLAHLNANTDVIFETCKIYGSIAPVRHKNDTCANPDPIESSVILKNGTLMTEGGYDATDKGITVIDESCKLKNVSYTHQLTIKSEAGSIYGIPEGTDASDITTTFKTNNFVTTFTVEANNPEKFTVTFYNADGVTPIYVAQVTTGTAVTPPAYSNSNGWYSAGYDGWTTTFGSTDKVTDFTITENTSFYPAKTEIDGTIIPNLSGAHYNLSFTGSIILNLYLPKAPTEVTGVKVTDKIGNVISGKGVYVSENGSNVYYKLYEIANLSPTRIAESTDVTVKFFVSGTEFSKTISLSPIKYAKAILSDSESAAPVWSANTHSMIADMIRYSNELSNASGRGYIPELDTLLYMYGKLCTPTSAHNTFADLRTSMYALNGYVTSVQFAISEFKPQWIINLNTAKNITDVSISLDGYYPSKNELGVNFGRIEYGIDESKTIRSGNYLKTAYIESMPVYNMDRDITITVTLSGGSKISGKYNLATYYMGMDAEGDTLDSWQKFLQTFRAFASSSSGYKYSEGEISATSPEKDFFDCDHLNARSKSFNQTNGQFCNTCNTYIFFYDSFINRLNYGGEIYSSREAAMSDKNNSYASIQFCHTKANQRATAGYKVGCVATPGAVYYLGYSTIYNGSTNEITVQTDTQWDGAYIISDESMIDVGDPAFNKPLFCFRGAASTTVNGITYSSSGTNVSSHFNSDIKAGAKKIPFAPGIPMMLKITDSTVKHYIRNGANENTGEDQNEMILIDEFGNVSNTTPIEWDYTYSSSTFSVMAYIITDTHVKLSGLGTDANGNTTYATFENIANNSVNATSYKSVGRGIVVRRSNVTVEGIYHEFTEDNTNLTPRQAYQGFRAWLGNNIVFKDISVEQHMNHYVQNADGTNTTNLLGSYEFSVDDANNVSWINCKVRNFFNDNGSLDYKGLFGTNGLRNAYLRDCFLTSFDSHSAAGNVTIENSTFEHINFIGAGNITLKNVTVYQADGGAAAIILRSDYGSRWRGNVYFDGLELRYDPNNYTKSYIDLIKAYYTNWDFGYGTHQGANERPANVYANNVSIMQYSRKASGNSTVVFDENGKVKESTLKLGTIKLGIYTQLNSQLKNSSYDYSTKNSYNKNPMGCTKNIYITNSNVTIQYPTHKFFSSMNIYIDGERINWY